MGKKADLILSCDFAVTAKADAEAKVKAAEQKVTELKARLLEVEKLVKTEEKWFNDW